MTIKLYTYKEIIEKDSSYIIKKFRSSPEEIKYTMGVYSLLTAFMKFFLRKWQARMYYGDVDNPWIMLFREYDKNDV